MGRGRLIQRGGVRCMYVVTYFTYGLWGFEGGGGDGVGD